MDWLGMGWDTPDLLLDHIEGQSKSCLIKLLVALTSKTLSRRLFSYGENWKASYIPQCSATAQQPGLVSVSVPWV